MKKTKTTKSTSKACSAKATVKDDCGSKKCSDKKIKSCK